VTTAVFFMNIKWIHDLKRHPLLENPTENAQKKDKADFEAITHFGIVYMFCSGSTEKEQNDTSFN
jgi:hypothetical protein